jgi:hypothetical protein
MSSSFRKSVRVLSVATLVLVAVSARAERKYVIGAKVDNVAGGSSYAAVSGLSGGELPTGFSVFYSTYPTIELTSTGENSKLDLSYTFGVYRLRSSFDVGSESHGVTASYDTKLGRHWRFRLSDSFQYAPDFTTFNALRGILLTAQGFQFVYNPVTARRSSLNNQSSGELDYKLGSKSNLTFGFSHGLREYADDPRFRGRLSDQSRIEGDVSYSRKVSRHGTWNVKYGFVRNEFKDFGSGNTHNVTLGYTLQVRPTVTLSFGAGPSYTVGLASLGDNVGYNASVGLTKSIHKNQLSLHYDRRSGDSSGLLALSNTHSVGLGVLRPITRRFNLTLDTAAYESRYLTEVAQKTRGVSGNLDLALALRRHWSVSGGAGYQKQEGSGSVDIENKRVYVALRFQAPEMWRFAR